LKYCSFGVRFQGWCETRKDALADALCEELGLSRTASMDDVFLAVSEHDPERIQIVGFRDLSTAERERLLEKAEAIYDRVMGVRRC